MQYGNFLSVDNECMLFFGVYNKDKGKKKSEGIVIERIMHDFISIAFSNSMTKGIPYKHTNLVVDRNFTEIVQCTFYEIQYIGKSSAYNEDFSNHIMKNPIFSQSDRNEMNNFLVSHKNELKYEKTEITKEKINQFGILAKDKLKREPRYEELGYLIKAFYDVETEFSNFLVHLIQLNDRIIDYKLACMHDHKENLARSQISLDELKEDVASWVAFKYFFVLLECINVILRLEDDDLDSIDMKKINIEGFQYDIHNMVDYVNRAISEYIISEENSQYGPKYYIIERFRNALAHGHIELEIDSNNEVIVVFTDVWNRRTEYLKIPISKLKDFLSDNDWSFDK